MEVTQVKKHIEHTEQMTCEQTESEHSLGLINEEQCSSILQEGGVERGTVSCTTLDHQSHGEQQPKMPQHVGNLSAALPHPTGVTHITSACQAYQVNRD